MLEIESPFKVAWFRDFFKLRGLSRQYRGAYRGRCVRRGLLREGGGGFICFPAP